MPERRPLAAFPLHPRGRQAGHRDAVLFHASLTSFCWTWHFIREITDTAYALILSRAVRPESKLSTATWWGSGDTTPSRL